MNPSIHILWLLNHFDDDSNYSYDVDHCQANFTNPYGFSNINHRPFLMPPYHQHPYIQSFSFVPFLPPYGSICNSGPYPYLGPQFSSVQRPLPPEDPELYPKIVKQIEYYFSKKNLDTDEYLRKNMDKNGWVDVSVIAEFRRMKKLTRNIYHILEALVSSSVVQVRGYKIRVRYNWKNWPLPRYFQLSTRNNYNSNNTYGVTELTNQVHGISIG